MSKSAQLALPLPFRPALGREDFLVGPANEAAVLWIDRWPHWPVAAVVLEGPAATGKTHLASVWQGRADAKVIDGQTLELALVPDLLELAKNWVVEAAETVPEQALLHFYNGTVEQSGALLLTAHTPPARWGTKLPSLSSRLATLPVASITVPDESLIRALLIKLFADRRAIVTLDVIDYIAVRIDRSFETAQNLVARIDALSLAEQRRITIPLVKQILESGSSATEFNIDER